MGQSQAAWLWSAALLREAADRLLEVLREGASRLSALELDQGSPPPGETRTRTMSDPEVVALADSHPWGVAAMLLVFALECLLKGRLARDAADVVSRDGVLQEQFKDHNLRRPVARARIDLPDADPAILDVLTEFLRWRGRYPIPTIWKALRDLGKAQVGTVADFQAKAWDLYGQLAG